MNNHSLFDRFSEGLKRKGVASNLVGVFVGLGIESEFPLPLLDIVKKETKHFVPYTGHAGSRSEGDDVMFRSLSRNRAYSRKPSQGLSASTTSLPRTNLSQDDSDAVAFSRRVHTALPPVETSGWAR